MVLECDRYLQWVSIFNVFLEDSKELRGFQGFPRSFTGFPRSFGGSFRGFPKNLRGSLEVSCVLMGFIEVPRSFCFKKHYLFIY